MELNKQQRMAERQKNFQAKYKTTLDKEDEENSKVMLYTQYTYIFISR